MAETVVLIPNYNGMKHLEKCLESLQRQTYGDFQIVIIDNGSTDRSCELITDRFPKVQIIEMEKNYGFAGAVNKGITATQSTYVSLLNNDVEVDPRWLEELVKALVDNSGVGAVACKMLNFYSRDEIDAAGDVLSRSGSAVARGHGESDKGQYDAEDEVFGPCAGAALYRRNIFESVGLFDDDFFAFYEDIDFDFRMQLQGWKAKYVPSAVCYHKRGATIQGMRAFAVRLHVRNHLMYMMKNIPVGILFGRFPLIVVSWLKSWYNYVRSGNLLPVVLGIAGAVLMIPSVVRKRREIQAKRRVPVEYIRSMMQ